MTTEQRPVAASEFPRVWVAWVKRSDGSTVPVIGKTTRHEYVHISELERLREAARSVIEAWKREDRAFCGEYETRREPLLNAIESLWKEVGE